MLLSNHFVEENATQEEKNKICRQYELDLSKKPKLRPVLKFKLPGLRCRLCSNSFASKSIKTVNVNDGTVKKDLLYSGAGAVSPDALNVARANVRAVVSLQTR